MKRYSMFHPLRASAKKEKEENETILYIYDEIDEFWGISAKDIVKEINAVKSGTLHIRLNSPGGAVFDGIAIANAIKQQKVHTVTHIDGLAASISSVIAVASDEIRMSDNAFLMIHDPWSIVMGTAKDMRQEADLLDKVGEQIRNSYMRSSAIEKEQVEEWMKAETWFTAKEALEYGLIDIVEEDKKNVENKAFDLSVFSNVPKQLQLKEKENITERELEKALRDAGCSRTQAKEILATGLRSERDAQDDIKLSAVRDAQPKPDTSQRDVEKPKGQEAIKRRDKAIDLIMQAKLVTLS
jgi:ATP-dependent Clp protease, protease subunit